MMDYKIVANNDQENKNITYHYQRNKYTLHETHNQSTEHTWPSSIIACIVSFLDQSQFFAKVVAG